jgi:ABC-type Mn2+/Zn2+ transport system permease subunit
LPFGIDLPIPTGDPDIGAFILVMGLGFVIGTAGHVYKSKTAVATGIALIFMATIGLPLILHFGGD